MKAKKSQKKEPQKKEPQKKETDPPFIVIAGDPVQGFQFFGPFPAQRHDEIMEDAYHAFPDWHTWSADIAPKWEH